MVHGCCAICIKALQLLLVLVELYYHVSLVSCVFKTIAEALSVQIELLARTKVIHLVKEVCPCVIFLVENCCLPL